MGSTADDGGPSSRFSRDDRQTKSLTAAKTKAQIAKRSLRWQEGVGQFNEVDMAVDRGENMDGVAVR